MDSMIFSMMIFFGEYGFSGGAFWINEEQDDPFYFLDDEY